jgi:UPF0755 protein
MRRPWRIDGRRWGLAGVAAAYLAAALGADFQRRYAGFGGELLLEIPRGTTSREIARLLEQNGVIRRQWHFLAARALRRHETLHAGEYKFDRPASPWEVYDRLARGDVHYYLLRVPEGANMFEIAEMAARLGLFPQQEFLAAARRTESIRDLAPEAPTLEGYLFPATYALRRRTTAEELCRMMTAKFREVWAELGGGAEVHATVTLASLIEKETAVAEERPLIASVFRNRLERRMPLQCDPTTIYAAMLDGRWRGAIHRSDLDRAHPYNTYRVAGLPPGPIANPGRESLAAALRPADTDFTYFVAKADGSGAHVFSVSLEAHNRAVWRFRNGPRQALRQSQDR